MLMLCRKKLHDLSFPKNVRYDKRGVTICKVCDNDYQKNKLKEALPVSLPPNTEPVINGYKEPLRPVVGGYGYIGTIAYDKTEQYTQCHICGYFYRHLGKHVRQAHDVGSNEYKEAFQLEKSTSLLATNTRTNYIQKWIDMSDEEREEMLQRLKKSYEENKFSGKIRGGRPHRLEYYNKKGSCPDQIIDKILVLSKEIERAPTLDEFQKRWGGSHYGKAARLHFGTWREAIRQAGLTPANRLGKIWYSNEQLLNAIISFKESNGREPYYSDVRAGLVLASDWVFRERFGSWTRAKELALLRDDG